MANQPWYETGVAQGENRDQWWLWGGDRIHEAGMDFRAFELKTDALELAGNLVLGIVDWEAPSAARLVGIQQWTQLNLSR